MTRVTHLNAKPGDYYLARLRSYAPWPAIICDEEILPVSLIESRPVTAAQEDGSYRADYADDGKRAHERTYPVMFFGTNELYIPSPLPSPSHLPQTTWQSANAIFFLSLKARGSPTLL